MRPDRQQPQLEQQIAKAMRNLSQRMQTNGWTKCAFAVSKSGDLVELNHPEAERFCAQGALLRELWTDLDSPSWLQLSRILHELVAEFTQNRFKNLFEFNDHPATRLEDIRALFAYGAQKYADIPINLGSEPIRQTLVD